jgi:hypothetical protein
MPVPDEVKNKKPIVFWYTTDLKPAAVKLAALLGKCPCVQVKLGKGSITSCDAIPSGGKAAWLVGHGLAGNTNIGTATHSFYVDLKDLLHWLQLSSYEVVVDTCCKPDSRRGLGKKSTLKYYCTADGRDVGVITTYSSVDTWWDTEKMALAT